MKRDLPPAITEAPEWERLRRAILARAVRFSGHLNFDFRELLTDASLARDAGRLMWQLVRPLGPEVLVGPGFGAAPLLFGIAHAALEEGVNLQVLMVRDQRKQHNQKRWVEGCRQAAQGKKTVLVDDFMREGSAVALVHEALAADGVQLQLLAVALFFDMWEPLGSRQLRLASHPVLSLFTRHDVGLSRDAYDALPPLMKGQHPALVGEQPLWWRLALNVRTDYPFKSSPVIADDAVFVSDDHSRMWRHDAASGDIQWRYDSLAQPRKGIVQRLQYVAGSLVFGCYDGTLTRLDGATGQVVWRWRQDSSVHATPCIDAEHGRIFINTEQWNAGAPFGHLQALDWATGRLLWTYTHAYWPPGSAQYSAAHGVVIAACNDESLIGVDADSGDLLWRQRTEGLVRGQPGISGDAVFAATERGRLHSFDIRTGEPRWTVRYGQGGKHQFTQVIDGAVITLDGHWHCSAFDASTGALRWLTRLRSPGNWCPVPMGPWWLVGSRQGHLAVLEPGHERKVWEGQIGGLYHQPPAVGRAAGRMLLAAASNDQGLKVFEVNPHYCAATP